MLESVGTTVLQAVVPLTTAAVSPFKKPVIAYVNGGFGSRYSFWTVLATTVSTARFTVSDPVPLLAVNSESPAKLALTAPGYEPSGMPAILVVKKAWPAPLVTPVPTVVPFTAKVIVFPEIKPPLDVFCNVALRIASPPKDAVAGETVKVEGPA